MSGSGLEVSGTLEGRGEEEQASKRAVSASGEMVQMGCKSEQCGRQQAGKQAGRSQEQHQGRSQQGALLQLTL